MYRQLKQTVRRAQNGSLLLRGESQRCEWLGNTYGGFFVDLSALDRSSIVYSVGIGEDISFDEALIARVGCEIEAYDPTPKSHAWLSHQTLPPGFRAVALAVGNHDGVSVFYLPHLDDHVSGSLVASNKAIADSKTISVTTRRLHTLLAENGHDHLDLLKLDIEGSEYDVVTDVLQSGVRLNQLAIEFHARLVPKGRARTLAAIDALRRGGMKLIAISDSGEEMTFVRNP